jgi:hypothetical protein
VSLPLQYFLPFEKKAINKLIEQAILEAENEGARVIGLGALNKVFFSVFSALPSSPIEVKVHCFYLLQKNSLQIKVLGKQNQQIFFIKIRSTKTLDAEKKIKFDQ